MAPVACAVSGLGQMYYAYQAFCACCSALLLIFAGMKINGGGKYLVWVVALSCIATFVYRIIAYYKLKKLCKKEE